MKKNIKKKLIILAVFLFVISSVFIFFNGQTYVYKVDINKNINDLKDVKINIDKKNVIKIQKISQHKGILEIELKSIKEGKTGISIEYNDYNTLEIFYVHKFGTITQNSFLGKSSNDIIIPIVFILYANIVLWILIKKYRESIKYNLYQYKNIVYISTIMIIITFILNNILGIYQNNGIIAYLHNTIKTMNIFSVLLFPIISLTSILVILSNINLIRKEGFSKKNILGIVLSLLVIISTLIPDILNGLLQVSNIIDIHNQKSIMLYIEEFIEAIIFTYVSYLECVLLSTIIIARKAAKHIPEYNKDYIIILGCKIGKDGSLTPLLKGRVDKAIEFAKKQKEETGKDIIFIPSGGKGNDEIISEGEAIKNYLIEQGIDKKKILVENKSKNTYENIKYSYNLIKENKKDSNIAFSTTNYHVFRAGNIAFNQKLNIEGMGSKTKTYFWINAFIREFVATLYNERKKHIITIGIVLLINLFIILMVYLSNIIS